MVPSVQVDELDVLIIDDDQDLAAMIGTVLAEHDDQSFAVRHLASATAGLQAYDQRPADVVVLDLSLPDAQRADPLGVLRQLLSRNPAPCVVVLTAHPWAGLGREALRMGAEDYIDKRRLTATALRDVLLYAVERHAHRARTAADEVRSSANDPTRDATRGAERLRGPLSVLTQALKEVRQASEPDPAERAKLLDQALRSAYAMAGQLDQVVAAQRRVEDREPVDLTALAGAVVADLEHLSESMGARIEVLSLPDVWGQREPLRLLLRNLAINALQHTRPRVLVRISASDHPRGLRIHVDDDGPGIPLERRSALFDAPTTATAHAFGLRACSAVATAHGGRCWVEDSPIGGTRVVVELPVRRRASA